VHAFHPLSQNLSLTLGLISVPRRWVKCFLSIVWPCYKINLLSLPSTIIHLFIWRVGASGWTAVGPQKFGSNTYPAGQILGHWFLEWRKQANTNRSCKGWCTAFDKNLEQVVRKSRGEAGHQDVTARRRWAPGRERRKSEDQECGAHAEVWGPCKTSGRTSMGPAEAGSPWP
jgi:hypothetical protein